MSEPAAILGTYADFKLIKTRSVLQLVIEVPLEMMPDAFAKIGYPTPGAENWVAVARVTKPAGGTDRGHSATGQPQDVRADGAPPAKPNSTRAVMMAKDRDAQMFLQERSGLIVSTDEAAEAVIKNLCRVESKTELNTGRGAALFEALRQDFYAWRRAA